LGVMLVTRGSVGDGPAGEPPHAGTKPATADNSTTASTRRRPNLKVYSILAEPAHGRADFEFLTNRIEESLRNQIVSSCRRVQAVEADQRRRSVAAECRVQVDEHYAFARRERADLLVGGDDDRRTEPA